MSGRDRGALARRLVFMLVAALAVGLAAGCGGSDDESSGEGSSSESLTPISFSLDFLIDGRYAPWFVAKEKGFYEDAGLDVTINPSQGAQEAVQALAAGRADAAFTDMGQLMVAKAQQDAPGKLVAVIYANPPYALFSAKEDDYTTPDSLIGKKIGTNAGSPMKAIWNILMTRTGIAPSDFEWVNLDPATKPQLLAAGQVDAIDNYLPSEPLLQQALAPEGVNAIRYSDLGLEIYSNGISFTEDYLNENPDVVAAFVKASLQGFEYAFEHPDEAAEIMTEVDPTLDPEVVKQQVAVLEELINGPGARRNGLGFMDPAIVEETAEVTKDTYGLSKVPDAAAAFTNDYLPGS
ncbi:MAG: hypothetical protein GEU88_00910 [Solirubrobacterales bacterium]|nr:hypothetical protein [Solirubrobacterales bacterium]